MEANRGWWPSEREDGGGRGVQVYPAPTTTTTTDPLLSLSSKALSSDGRSRHKHTHTVNRHRLTKPGVQQPPVALSLTSLALFSSLHSNLTPQRIQRPSEYRRSAFFQISASPYNPRETTVIKSD